MNHALPTNGAASLQAAGCDAYLPGRKHRVDTCRPTSRLHPGAPPCVGSSNQGDGPTALCHAQVAFGARVLDWARCGRRCPPAHTLVPPTPSDHHIPRFPPTSKSQPGSVSGPVVLQSHARVPKLRPAAHRPACAPFNQAGGGVCKCRVRLLRAPHAAWRHHDHDGHLPFD